MRQLIRSGSPFSTFGPEMIRTAEEYAETASLRKTHLGLRSVVLPVYYKGISVEIQILIVNNRPMIQLSISREIDGAIADIEATLERQKKEVNREDQDGRILLSWPFML